MRTAWVLAVAVGSGCAVAPAERNREILETCASLAGLPVDVEGFAVCRADVRAAVITVHYLRENPRGEMHVMRFAESPNEQHPDDLRSLELHLAAIAAGKEEFLVLEEDTPDATIEEPLRGAFYRFTEAGMAWGGYTGLWRRVLDQGAWIYFVDVVTPDRPSTEFVLSILRAFGAL